MGITNIAQSYGETPEEFVTGPDAARMPITAPSADDHGPARLFAKTPIFQTPTPNYPITSVESAVEGQIACIAGARTGGSCGVVTQTGLNDTGQYRIATCRFRRGDSGSAIFREGTALGTLSYIAPRSPASIANDKAAYESKAGPNTYPAIQGSFACPNGAIANADYGLTPGGQMEGWGAYAGAYDLPNIEEKLKVRVRTVGQYQPRVSITWDKTTDIDLYAWWVDGNGVRHGSIWGEPDGIPDTQLGIEWHAGHGPEFFDETTPARTLRGFTFGACYYGPRDGATDVTVTATIVDPSGAVRIQQFELDSFGQETVFGASPASALSAPPPGWCVTANDDDGGVITS